MTSTATYTNSESPMYGWPLQRRENGLLEALCPHGTGHPVPESVARLGGVPWGTHGCDGCCVGRDPRDAGSNPAGHPMHPMTSAEPQAATCCGHRPAEGVLMRATLEFALPEREREHEIAVRAVDFLVAIEEIVDWLRRRRNYEEMTLDARGFADETWEELHRIINDRGLARLLS